LGRSLLFVTGTRADFGKLDPLARAACDAGFLVTFFVTGMHMIEKYGLTKIEVHRTKGVQVAEFSNQVSDDGQDIILAKTVMGFSKYIKEHKPDLVVVHGDRIEALACALVCATNYIRSAHIEGGEVSGTIDEIFRHCNTKLAATHFVSSDAAAKRVQALGEPLDSVHVIGSPELDFHAAPSGVNITEVKDYYDIAFDDYGICIFHPVTSEVGTMGRQARALFDSLQKSERNFVLIAPNNDPASNQIFDVINGLDPRQFRLLPSMRFGHFSELMKNASVMIGNSSAGVREAPFLGLASLDIGTRQTNRANAPSLRAAKAEDATAIATFLGEEWGKSYPRHMGFGQGSAAQRFVDIISDASFWTVSLQKEFRDFES
jgi:UDP-N-acetylglucosamine 2-epimerase (hydrolysing)